MHKDTSNSESAVHLILANAQELLKLLDMVRTDIAQRDQSPNSFTKRLEFDVDTEHGPRRPYLTLHMGVETQSIVAHSLSLVAECDVARGEKHLCQIIETAKAIRLSGGKA